MTYVEIGATVILALTGFLGWVFLHGRLPNYSQVATENALRSLRDAFESQELAQQLEREQLQHKVDRLEREVQDLRTELDILVNGLADKLVRAVQTALAGQHGA